MNKKSAAIALAVVSAALPLTVSAPTASAATAALPGNCTITRVPGAPYPGADVICTTGQGYYRAIVYCLSSRIGGTEHEYKGAIVSVADKKHSRAFCTASYPVYNGGHMAYYFP